MKNRKNLKAPDTTENVTNFIINLLVGTKVKLHCCVNIKTLKRNVYFLYHWLCQKYLVARSEELTHAIRGTLQRSLAYEDARTIDFVSANMVCIGITCLVPLHSVSSVQFPLLNVHCIR